MGACKNKEDIVTSISNLIRDSEADYRLETAEEVLEKIVQRFVTEISRKPQQVKDTVALDFRQIKTDFFTQLKTEKLEVQVVNKMYFRNPSLCKSMIAELFDKTCGDQRSVIRYFSRINERVFGDTHLKEVFDPA